MKHLKTFIGALALFAALSCTKNHAEVKGQVSFSVANDPSVEEVTKSNVSDFTALPATGDFIITISDASDALVWEGKLSEWDPAYPLAAGDYSVEAVYGNLEDEGFGKPYFVGSETFKVIGGETTSVSMQVYLNNTIVRISCSDYFRKYYTGYTFKLTRNGADVVTFTKDETRAAFIDGYKITVEGTLTSETKTQTFSTSYNNLDEGTAYTIAFDAVNVGGSTITISFNDEVVEVPLGNFELND